MADQLFINGAWVSGERGTFEVTDPATEDVIATVADGGVNNGRAAVDAAQDAFDQWRRTAPRERGELLRRTFELMHRDIDRLTELISAENGKALADARAEVVYAAEFFRWFSEEAVRSSGRWGEAPAGGVRNIVTHHPIGVAALVTPWNFPAAMATRKIAPALAAGCTVVLKPASETPLTAFAVAELMVEAGLPPGVVNVVTTTKSGELVSSWLEDPRVRMLSFTGSTAVGRLLLKQAAERVVVTGMELGGNAPFVVAADADLERAIDSAMVAKLRGGGQACTAANRFYVHEAVAEEFAERLGAAYAKLRVGAAADGADIGPLISAKAVAEISHKVDEAVAAGARITQRLPVPDSGRGHFLAPVVLADVPADSVLVTEETFGPVAPIVTWSDDTALLDMVNGSEFGLAAYVHAGDLQWAITIAERIEAGMVGINRGLVSDPSAPFGGVKQSGLGREGAREGLEEFLETQYLSIAWE
ncbi:NAD-dependent succinate-semialdehyde dehydrogenase [Nocardioides limicola]|uniref:NAD-dependent succinate-semialdehyde dehydrogenase n=1 Tax=Nocardioides limicola TaxID=2803368 RepID=UPI0027DB8B59|nr:NAD-dependent succinate-semialdehyde dehydrogenase [Nocardioides sp. DJM-14]